MGTSGPGTVVSVLPARDVDLELPHPASAAALTPAAPAPAAGSHDRRANADGDAGTEVIRPGRRAQARHDSPPDGGVQVLDLFHRAGVNPGGEVLGSVVGHDEHDVALVQLVGDPDRDPCDRA